VEIVFDLPHAFGPGSSPEERTAVVDLLKRCARECGCGLSGPKGTQVAFQLGKAFSPGSSPRENARKLYALLGCLKAINLAYIQRRGLVGVDAYGSVVPTYDTPVYYDRTIVWDSIPALQARGYGDCKSLACAIGAEYEYRGYKTMPVHRYVRAEDSDTGQMQYHILVLGPYGFEDMSKVKGMGYHENAAPLRQRVG